MSDQRSLVLLRVCEGGVFCSSPRHQHRAHKRPEHHAPHLTMQPQRPTERRSGLERARARPVSRRHSEKVQRGWPARPQNSDPPLEIDFSDSKMNTKKRSTPVLFPPARFRPHITTPTHIFFSPNQPPTNYPTAQAKNSFQIAQEKPVRLTVAMSGGSRSDQRPDSWTSTGHQLSAAQQLQRCLARNRTLNREEPGCISHHPSFPFVYGAWPSGLKLEHFLVWAFELG